VEEEVPVDPGGGEDPDRAVFLGRVPAGVLQGPPGRLEEQPVLRVGAGRFVRGEPEEPGVEVLDPIDPAAGADVRGVGAQAGADAQRGQLVVGVVVDRVDAGAEVPPERRRVRGAGEPAGEPDHGDQVAAGLVLVAGRHHGAWRVRSGPFEVGGLRRDRRVLQQA
jgi:hypothetical protein